MKMLDNYNVDLRRRDYRGKLRHFMSLVEEKDHHFNQLFIFIEKYS